jgi:hypothetical protein
MKIQVFVLGVTLAFLCSCTGGGGYQRHYIISDTSTPTADEDPR